MTESEFLVLAEAALGAIERAVEYAAEANDVDIECSRSGNVLEIELIDSGSKIIVNSQAPMQELWVAARSGGFHYRQVEEKWLDTRTGEELFAALSRILSLQTGQTMALDFV